MSLTRKLFGARKYVNTNQLKTNRAQWALFACVINRNGQYRAVNEKCNL